MLFFFSYTHLGAGGPVTDTTRLQLPVDYQMAGDADKFGKGRIGRKMLQHVFNEKD